MSFMAVFFSQTALVFLINHNITVGLLENTKLHMWLTLFSC